MKVKTIAGKLALALILALVVLALAVGLSFSALFRDYSREAAREQLAEQSKVILSLVNAGMQEAMGRGQGRGQPQMRGSANYRRYLQALNTQANIDAWVVDREGHLTTGYQQSAQQLPEDMLPLYQAVLSGETRFQEGFSSQQGLPTLTLGVPIPGESSVEGALLLHTPLSAVRQAEAAGLRTLLFSVLIGLALALQFLEHGDNVGRLGLVDQLADHGVDQAVLVAVEVAVDEQVAAHEGGNQSEHSPHSPKTSRASPSTSPHLPCARLFPPSITTTRSH